jgi:hypothetical protein
VIKPDGVKPGGIPNHTIMTGMFLAMTKYDQKWDHSSAMIVRAMYDLGVDLFPSSLSLHQVLKNLFENCNAIPEVFDVMLSVGAAQVDPEGMVSEVLDFLTKLLQPFIVEAADVDAKSRQKLSATADFIKQQFLPTLSAMIRRSRGSLGVWLSRGKCMSSVNSRPPIHRSE